MSTSEVHRFISRSPQETRELVSRRVATELRPGDVVTLYGPVGSGKTVVSQAIAEALGIQDPITSATFTILAEYPAPFGRFVHADLYRLHGTDDVIETGIEDVLLDPSTITVVEWADRAPDVLEPVETVRVDLAIEPDGARLIGIHWSATRSMKVANPQSTEGAAP